MIIIISTNENKNKAIVRSNKEIVTFIFKLR